MSRPTPLTVFDRRSGQTFDEFMDDSPATYESHPSRAPDQWLKAHPLYDWLVALWQNTPWSARKITPFVRKHRIDMSEFEPGPFRNYADFFEVCILDPWYTITVRLNFVSIRVDSRFIRSAFICVYLRLKFC